MLAFALLCAGLPSPAGQAQGRVVRLAELEIDPLQLENYKAALREEIDTSIRILEIYADVAAYKAHLETPHFKKYKTLTQGMIKSLNLVDTDPIRLAATGK